ncbi:hypothetical protein CHARACLAT_033535 [Characodon lateralis]|uniref:Testicular haploid expressed protein n=1 Tax=Characodon lateralis TaxID=208331 RepID=A0ABU7ESR7_9TELE|nr:hypothetical protein [Characodon lateralis]
MTPSHSSHFLIQTQLTTLSSLPEFGQPSDPSGRAEIQSRKGSVSLMKTAVRTVFTGIYQPAGILRRNWNPAPKAQSNVRFKQPKILITSQKEEKDKELVISLAARRTDRDVLPVTNLLPL